MPPSRRWKYHASMSGIAIFMISEGWITTPTFSQRFAPLRVSPKVATAISSAMPMVYSGTAKRISVGGGTLARIHISPNVSMMLRNWSSTRPGTSRLALYSVTMPTHSSRNTISASGLSKPANMRFVRSSQTRLSNCSACMAILLYSSMPPDGVNVWMALLPELRGIAAVGAGSFVRGVGVGAAGALRTSAVRVVSFALAAPGAFVSVAGRAVSRASVMIGATGTRGASSARSMLGATGTADAAGTLDAAAGPLLAGADADAAVAESDAAAPALALAAAGPDAASGLNAGDAPATDAGSAASNGLCAPPITGAFASSVADAAAATAAASAPGFNRSTR